MRPPEEKFFNQRGDRVTLAPQRQEDIVLECKPEALAAVSIVHRSLRRKLDGHIQTGGWCLQDRDA